MPSICFYFQVHQPFRLKKYRVFDIGKDRKYFNGTEGNLNNEWVLRKVASKSYIPTNETLLYLLKKNPGFKVSFSLSGVILDQFKEYAPEVVDSFRALVETGQVEILDETYYHSLAFLYSRDEFIEQIRMHRSLIKEIFGVEPEIFRHTELIYNNDVGALVSELGYKGILAEGADHILEWRSPDFVYKTPGNNISLLLKNYKLSDDVAFRFSSKSWEEYPLTAEKYANWISAKNGTADVINLFMDYETFGEHQWEDTGIFKFLRALPRELLNHPDNRFLTPSEVVSEHMPVAELDVPHLISWADIERDLTAWTGNPMQQAALKAIYELEPHILSCGDRELVDDWRKLQTSDHFYYMCTKWFADGDVHAYFNPYETPYDAFISFMNVLQDLKLRLLEKNRERGEVRLAPVTSVI